MAAALRLDVGGRTSVTGLQVWAGACLSSRALFQFDSILFNRLNSLFYSQVSSAIGWYFQ